MGFFSFRNRKDQAEGGADGRDGSPFRLRSEETSPSRARARKRGAGDPVDPVLPEKQRARRRLIGAATLVLAAVVGLPMVLGSEPRPLADDVVIDIPAKERAKPVAAKLPLADTLDAREELLADAASKSSPAETPDPSLNAPAPAKGATAAALAAGAAAKVADPQATSELKPTSLSQPPPKSTDKPVERAAERPSEKVADKPAEKSAEKSSDKKVDRPSEKTVEKVGDKAERFHLQVGAFSSPEKVRELQKKLQAAGHKSSAQTVVTPSGERIRVRIGPVNGRAEAEKMRAKLGKMGLSASLVPA